MAEPRTPSPAGGLESTAVLLDQARAGSDAARETLAARYYAILSRFAHGRLPSSARGMLETGDLVQISVVRALEHLDRFEPQREGAFLAYLRRIVINQIRDQIRSAARRPAQVSVSQTLPGSEKSPLEELVGRESLELFEKALAQLPARDREAVMLRVEFGFSHEEIAQALRIRTANAARMCVSRAIAALAAKMRELGAEP